MSQISLVVKLKMHSAIRARADQNTDAALLKLSMRAAIHGASHVSSAVYVCNNYQIYAAIFSHSAIA